MVANQNINCVANGMLNITSVLYGIYNIFEYGEGLRFDLDLAKEDIDRFGLFAISDFKGIIDSSLFEAYNFKYFKVSIGKGLMSYEQLLFYIKWLKFCMDSGEAIIYKGQIFL